jgi:hypothetical protein
MKILGGIMPFVVTTTDKNSSEPFELVHNDLEAALADFKYSATMHGGGAFKTITLVYVP